MPPIEDTEETLDDENIQYDDQEGDEAVEEGDDEDAAQDAPVDLADAFKRYQSSQREQPEETVEDGGEDDDEGGEVEADEDGAVSDDGDLDDRGPSADSSEPFDYSAAADQLVKGIQQAAVAQVNSAYRKQGIRKFSVGDLIERKSDGTVVFHNPENPNRPFASRMEAQQWVDSVNKDIDASFRREAGKAYQDLMRQNESSIRLLKFAPKYNALSPEEQELFDDMVEDYGVYQDGEVIGYSCDLDRVLTQVKRVMARMQPKAAKKPQAKQAAKPRQPSMDMRGRGTGSNTAKREEPKDLAEAMKMYNEMHRKDRSNG